jgi:Lipid desaturase domain
MFITPTKRTAQTPQKSAAQEAKSASPEQGQAPGDQVQIDWSGNKPAHRSVKKMTRGIAALTTAAGVGKAVFDVATSSDMTSGLMKAGISLAVTAGAVTAIDIGSGIAHHLGDNYLHDTDFLRHTQWHTETDNAEYCMVGFSNKALDKMGFFPKMEKAIHSLTGKEPVSWQVPEYRSFCLGEITEEQLKQKQVESGMVKS